MLFQFWDDADAVPADVQECLESWRPFEEHGFERVLFDDPGAVGFITRHLGSRYSAAFGRCPHPAMRSDYFRLCFLARNGGFYVDADEAYQGSSWEHLFADDRLKVQALCYDASTEMMIPPDLFATRDEDSPDWTFYVNNNPIIAPPGHRIVRLALARATRLLLSAESVDRRNIQSITGPGNLTASLVRHAVESRRIGRKRDFAIIANWDAISVSRWPLSYRNDGRNWRLWSQLS